MRNAGLDDLQTGIRLPGEILKTSDLHMIPLKWQKAKKTKQPLEGERGE